VPADKKSVSVLIGAGFPGAGRDGEDGETDAKTAAGEELIEAVKSKDGKAVCEAVKNIMALESYDDEDEEEEESNEAAE